MQKQNPVQPAPRQTAAPAPSSEEEAPGLKARARSAIKALGLVFGDIGTSPIYTLTVIFLILTPTRDNIYGILSLVFWTLIILVTVEYAWLAMSLGKRGEGGTVVLHEILRPFVKSAHAATFISAITYLGVSLIIGDGVITPAISILSAVEGLILVPGLEKIGRHTIIWIAAAIAIGLFAFQKKGTERVTRVFGPVMLLWFVALFISGLKEIVAAPGVLLAVSPHYGLKFLAENGVVGLMILSEVILCATGGEALYADMGHLGRQPITEAWRFVFVALVINYFGQGAYLLTHPGGGDKVFFAMVHAQTGPLYVPFLVLSITATIIASQALISGMFSIVYQGISTGIMPLLKISYTSAQLRSQIFIGSANSFLLVSVLAIMFIFGESSKLAAAYGLAVTGTMAITGIMMTWIFLYQASKAKAAVAFLITLIDFVYLAANLTKLPHGGFYSLIIALFPFVTILVYARGQQRLHQTIQPLSLDAFLEKYDRRFEIAGKVSGAALFLLRDVRWIPPYIVRTMFTNGILYEENILASIVRLKEPYGVYWGGKEELSKGLYVFTLQAGYMEVIDAEAIFRKAALQERAIFYGLEDIKTNNPIWKFFAVIKRNTPSFVQFYKFPSGKLHGVITSVDL